ncbi:DUF6562 domain-containing protein [Phocaeicola salanitronis]|uniref:DUF6562 domain-containing protein n=1 Tax=Phocaeicola salanitronis TaxID=376805 RepID=UPI0023F947DE|nr:DUF6562 domain-containing protein [Phocaeicola salanitronis]
MKKNFLYSLTALFVMLFASCSQEEIVSTADAGMGDNKVRLSVNISDEALISRASQSLDVEGYVMRCICQAVNVEGTLIDGFNQVVAVENGKASFEFEAPEGVANYLFWADYVEGDDIKASKSAFYNATSLLEVKYNLNKNVKLFNNPAADAFCAVTSAANIGGSITLKRPFSRIAIKTSDLEKLGLTGLDIITPGINATQGYSVLNQTVSAAVTLQLNTGETLKVATGDLAFYCYIFPVTEIVEKNTTIKFTSASDTNGKTVTASVEKMREDASSSNNSIFLEKDEEQPTDPEDPTKINVDVVIDNEYTGEEGGGEEPGTDPEPSTEMQIGSYVNASGEVVATATDAVGIVFALGAIGDDAPANYPAALQGKAIKAYAVALENVAASRQQLNAEAITLTENAPVNGTQNTEALLTALNNSAFVTTYSSWVSENATSGENVSSWYIPALPQLQQFMNMLFTMGDTPATGSDVFKGMSEFALTNGAMFDRDPIATVNYASCTVNDQGNLSGVRINVTDGTVTNAQAAGINVTKGSQSVLCRPMFTIFE